MDLRYKELLEEAQKADKIDKERAARFEALVKHPGWTDFEALLTLRIETLGSAMLEPSGSVDQMVALEFVKGTMRGLLLARDLPRITIAAMKAAKPGDGEE